MNQQKKLFQRKIIYLAIAVGLLFPMFLLSHPATRGVGDTGGSAGGLLAQVRTENNLSQADLGGIDPAGSAMKLSMFGMSGIASTVLWTKSHRFRDREDWTGYNAALEQITKLQPNFSSVWINQGHNLSYNISVELDDYRDRFHYVIRGLELLKRGVRYNQHDPKLIDTLAFFTGQKIGRADEYEQFRELFRSQEYDDFYFNDAMEGTLHAGRPTDPRLRDNWLVSKWWYERAEALIDHHNAPYQGLNPTLLHNQPAKSQMQYGSAIQEEGTFGPQAQQAWRTGGEMWADYARRRLPTTLGFSIALGDLERHRQLEKELSAQLDELAPGIRARLISDRRAALTDLERSAIDTPPAERTPQQELLAYAVQPQVEVSDDEVLERIESPDALEQARRILDRIRLQRQRVNMIERYRGVVNFEAWQNRCEVEQRDRTLAAREAIYRGDQAYLASNLTEALAEYDAGIAAWAEVLDDFPNLLDDGSMIYDLIDVIRKYQIVLGQNNLPMPEPFPLQSVIDLYFQRGMDVHDDEPLQRGSRAAPGAR